MLTEINHTQGAVWVRSEAISFLSYLYKLITCDICPQSLIHNSEI